MVRYGTVQPRISMGLSLQQRSGVPFLAAAGLAALFFLLGYPGVVNSDTLDIIYQGNSGQTSTYHSPSASVLISILSHALPAPQCIIALTATGAAMAVVQIFRVCIAGNYRNFSVARSFLSAVQIALFVLLALLVSILSTQAIKDAWISLIFLGFAAASLTAHARGRPLSRVLGLGLCFGAVLVKPTTALVTVPLVALLVGANSTSIAGDVRAAYRRSLLQTAANTMAVALAFVAGLYFVNLVVTGARLAHPEASTQLFDVLGVAVQQNDPAVFASEQLEMPVTGPELQECYHSYGIGEFLWGACSKTDVPLAQLGLGKSPRGTSFLLHVWLRVIRQEPQAFLRHKIAFTRQLMARVDRADGARLLFPGEGGAFDSVPPEMRAGISRWQPSLAWNVTTRITSAVFATPLGSPWLWILIDIACCTVAMVGCPAADRPLVNLAIAIAVSAALNDLSFAIAAASAEPRYLYWSLLGTILAAMLVTTVMLRSLRDRPAVKPKVVVTPQTP